MTDKLREMMNDGLEAACDLQNWIEDNVDETTFEKIPVDIWNRITHAVSAKRAVLAAAPQPMGCGLPCGYDCNGACFDAAAPQPAPEWEICEVCRGTGFAGHPDSGNTCYLCNGSGAVDPPPAITDRQALVRLLQIITRNGSLDDGRTLHEVIADALLARGLRLPGVVYHKTASRDTQAPLPVTDDTQAAPETMAWAVTTREGRIDPHMLFDEKPNEEEWRLPPNGKVLRVAIRVVEGGDDE